MSLDSHSCELRTLRTATTVTMGIMPQPSSLIKVKGRANRYRDTACLRCIRSETCLVSAIIAPCSLNNLYLHERGIGVFAIRSMAVIESVMLCTLRRNMLSRKHGTGKQSTHSPFSEFVPAGPTVSSRPSRLNMKMAREISCAMLLPPISSDGTRSQGSAERKRRT